MRLFLCHLYFSSHCCYSALPAEGLISNRHRPTPPLSHSFPPVSSLDWRTTSPQLRLRDADGKHFVFSESLLALAHYRDCAAMIAQCEAVLRTKVGWGERNNRAWLAGTCAHCLLEADRYKLDRWRSTCIQTIATADKSILQNVDYQRARQSWEAALVLEILEARKKSK